MLSSCEFDYYHTLNLHLKILPQYLYMYIFLLTSSHLTSISLSPFFLLLYHSFSITYLESVVTNIHVNVHNNMIRNLYTLGLKIRRNFRFTEREWKQYFWPGIFPLSCQFLFLFIYLSTYNKPLSFVSFLHKSRMCNAQKNTKQTSW